MRKHLQQDLTDIEFYSSVPCFIYIESGREVITDSNNHKVELHAGSGVFLPQGEHLHSDYVKCAESLQAYLVFFDEHVITEFLAGCKGDAAAKATKQSFYTVEDNEGDINGFFRSINCAIADPGYLSVKLHELLHLIAWKADAASLRALLAKQRISSPKRNLQRLLENHDVLRLSVSDLAQISCRSLSSFNRDFKAIYKVPPQTWLREKRLAHARELLDSKGVSVTEAAVEVGYENVSHFIKAFKLKYGRTPKQIKNA